MAHYIIIGIIIAILVLLQFYIFVKNLIQMHSFRSIFGKPKKAVKYEPIKNLDGQVIGVKSDFDNLYFERIRTSIGEYMKANAGGTIDFQLIKDAVDRNCDSIEEDANAQIPLPLYIGLAGTMLGVIIGIGYLWLTGQLDTLLDLTPSVENMQNGYTGNGSDGIKTLLSGVALAMIASISGLTFTTLATWIFKGIKLEVEIGKNSFFTWMQSTLLPEVATDTVDALRRLGHTLGSFNRDFSRNSDAFGKTMDHILGVNSTQNKLLENVDKMHNQVATMSQKNLEVAERMSKVMNVLDDFADYVNSINGYTTALQNFTTSFNDEADRLKIMESMKDFFESQSRQLKDREDALKKGMGKLDNALLEGSNQLKTRFSDSNDELKKMMTLQKEQFKILLKSQSSMFEEAQKNLISSIRTELSAVPTTVSALNNMPDKIKVLLDGYKKENDKLVSELSKALSTMNQTLKVLASSSRGDSVNFDTSGAIEKVAPAKSFPRWMTWVILFLIFIMSAACVSNLYLQYKLATDKKEKLNQIESSMEVNKQLENSIDSVNIETVKTSLKQDSLNR